jgi:exodeoxyribonuclease VII small subunit
MARKKQADTKEPETLPAFEDSLAQVARVVEQLEAGDLSLAASLAAYEEGIKQLKYCHLTLDDAERRIELLAGFDAAGNPVLQEFDDTATSGEEPSGRASRSPTKPAPTGRTSENVDQRDLFPD